MTIFYDYGPAKQRQQAERIAPALEAELSIPGQRLYLLVDPVSLPGDVHHPLVSALVALRPAPVRLPHFALTAGSYPWLLPLDRDNQQQAALLTLSIDYALQELHPQRLSQGKGRAICGWLVSKSDPATLARQLGETAIQKMPGGAFFLLRYYDPAVHSVLWLNFCESERRRLLGVLSAWIYADGDGQPVIHRHHPADHPLMVFTLKIGTEEAELIEQTGLINRTLEQYRRRNLMGERHEEAEAIAIVQAAFARADSVHGFTKTDDQQALALDCLSGHARFDMHSTVRMLLSSEERSARASYARCVATLTDSERQQICTELSAANAAEDSSTD